MALPALELPDHLAWTPIVTKRPRSISDAIASLASKAAEIERSGKAFIAWQTELRERIQTDILENGPREDSAEYIMTALKLMLTQAELISREYFDAQAADELVRPFASQMTPGQRRALRKSAVRVETAQKNLVSRIRQNADALFAFYDDYMKNGPPDPWPPQDRTD